MTAVGDVGSAGNSHGSSDDLLPSAQVSSPDGTARHGQTQKITIEDIEGRLRSLTSKTNEEADSVRDTAGKYTVVGLGIAVVVAYLVGRHRGRLKSAVIEIKRG